jgi:hypothetical protein
MDPRARIGSEIEIGSKLPKSDASFFQFVIFLHDSAMPIYNLGRLHRAEGLRNAASAAAAHEFA